MNRNERGSALLEGSLVLLTFLVMLLGTIDFGQVLYCQQTLMERARAAARYGAINPTSTDSIKNIAVYGTATTTGSPRAVLTGLTTSMVSVTNSDANSPEARVVVMISNYPMDFLLTPYSAHTFSSLNVSAAATAENQVP